MVILRGIRLVVGLVGNLDRKLVDRMVLQLEWTMVVKLVERMVHCLVVMMVY